MTNIEWETWLARWNRELIDRLEPGRDYTDPENDLTTEIIASGWLGYPGATEEQIEQLETRLGMPLPPSYRAFLRSSNGFRQPGVLVPRLLPIGEVDWFRQQNQETIDMLKSYELEDLTNALAISARERTGTAIYLLNPDVVDDDGEWEAIYYAHWMHPCPHYCSFPELMQRAFRTLLWNHESPGKLQIPEEDLPLLGSRIPLLIEEFDRGAQQFISSLESYELRERLAREAAQKQKEFEDLIKRARENIKTQGNDQEPKQFLFASFVQPVPHQSASDQHERDQTEVDYNKAALESLEAAKTRVLEIQANFTQPEDLYRELMALLQETKERYQNYMSARTGGYRRDRAEGLSQGSLVAFSTINSWFTNSR